MIYVFILSLPDGTEPKYLTTVIPYNLDTAPDNQTLQILIKSKYKTNNFLSIQV